MSAPGDTLPLITVLGASGMVGSAITAVLARRRVRLRVVARRPVAPVPTGPAEIETRTADLSAPGALADVLHGSDVVIHLVAHDGGWRALDTDAESERINVGVLRETLDFWRGADGARPVVVFAGSTSQVGPVAKERIDGTEPDHPETRYDRQKQQAERLLKAATADGRVRGVSLRLPTVFGPAPIPPGDKGVLATMARRALTGEPLTLWHGSEVRRDFLFVDDVADAFAAAVEHADALAGGHWLLGTGRGVPLRGAFETVAKIVGECTGSPPVPVTDVPPPAHVVPGDNRSAAADPSRFRSLTGWSPRVSLRDGLERTVASLVRTAPRV
ncbi:NAD-dependent epimerase/dehydratase family protein [Nocardiopsis ansamitocini]|uniref:NAD-dependent epimerase/dehydratase domain-containing protein n=1 Tax=Nocardiopsis ansamitocini TaxID=1670832 RepID=A0A9W6P739_9ACTN|nr:NAD-dependent epimerase/dehydratase family protein [Nocardiopsis ansamitocini]GLU48700.1 hypothetical protein Nans01_30510 [Nocardiopsis ansamitocini]